METCSNFVATQLLLKFIICKVFLALLNPFNYICTSANVNCTRCKIFK